MLRGPPPSQGPLANFPGVGRAPRVTAFCTTSLRASSVLEDRLAPQRPRAADELTAGMNPRRFCATEEPSLIWTLVRPPAINGASSFKLLYDQLPRPKSPRPRRSSRARMSASTPPTSAPLSYAAGGEMPSRAAESQPDGVTEGYNAGREQRTSPQPRINSIRTAFESRTCGRPPVMTEAAGISFSVEPGRHSPLVPTRA